MKSPQALRVLAATSASQWGMVTTSQAAAHGVGRLELSRLAKAGHLERLTHGVYRDAGAPSDEFESLRAAWLATDPSIPAENRLDDLAAGVVVTGASAASLHGVGDLPADRHEFSAPVRRQSQRPEVRFRRRDLEPDDVTIAHGLPTTTVERTIADLVEARTDLSLVAHVLNDAARACRLDTDRLEELLSPLAARNGLRKGDGAALLDHLMTLAGLDAHSLADQIASSEPLASLVTANRLAGFSNVDTMMGIDPEMQQGLRALQEAFASFGQEWAATLMRPFADSRADLIPAIDVLQAASGIGLVNNRG